ncbi:glutathione S-transferase theta-1 isoform X1 [Drosophila sulfurigaster albostrigata]|uniref:glutathione S-transferase theta-1 isoform X1 n=2 Tax=Drosophila sulfurigaster albostrigata TaxID=89887 RepID=UPI002D218E3F|nr:glutathione S-transferase theta-1 isoform X1 [Drosophila sulfurigaster albostrigata]
MASHLAGLLGLSNDEDNVVPFTPKKGLRGTRRQVANLDVEKMSSLRFYYDLMSQPSRALFIIFRLSGMQYEDCVVQLRNGEHLTDEFKHNINRFQRVPCINDNGYKLAESVAILRYLSAKGKIPEHLYPKYFVDQGRVDEFLEWQHNTIRVTCALYFRTVWLDPLLTGRAPTEAKIETLRILMERNLDIIEEVWLAKSEFLTGSSLTVADIFAACEIEQTRMADYDVRIKYPKIRAWLKRVRQSCNPHYDTAHHFVYKISGTGPQAKL